MKKLLFGYDGSDQAKRAMADFSAACLPTPVHATVLTVADVWMPASPGPHISKTASAALAEAKKISAEGG